MREKILDFIKKPDDVMPELNQENVQSENTEQQVPAEPVVYKQWFEKDPIRLDLEIQKVQENFPDLKCVKLTDARISFNGTIDNYEIYLMCDYNYPLKPPEAFILNPDENSKSFADENGKIEIFQIVDFVWQANDSFIVDVLKKIRDFIKICSHIKEQG